MTCYSFTSIFNSRYSLLYFVRTKRRKQNEQKVYKNSRQPVAYVAGKGAACKDPPKERLARYNSVMPGRSGDYIVSESLREAYESQQRHSDRRRSCHSSKSCSEKERTNNKKFYYILEILIYKKVL